MMMTVFFESKGGFSGPGAKSISRTAVLLMTLTNLVCGNVPTWQCSNCFVFNTTPNLTQCAGCQKVYDDKDHQIAQCNTCSDWKRPKEECYFCESIKRDAAAAVKRDAAAAAAVVKQAANQKLPAGPVKVPDWTDYNWTCSQCTFANEAMDFACKNCGEPSTIYRCPTCNEFSIRPDNTSQFECQKSRCRAERNRKRNEPATPLAAQPQSSYKSTAFDNTQPWLCKAAGCNYRNQGLDYECQRVKSPGRICGYKKASWVCKICKEKVINIGAKCTVCKNAKNALPPSPKTNAAHPGPPKKRRKIGAQPDGSAAPRSRKRRKQPELSKKSADAYIEMLAGRHENSSTLSPAAKDTMIKRLQTSKYSNLLKEHGISVPSRRRLVVMERLLEEIRKAQ